MNVGNSYSIGWGLDRVKGHKGERPQTQAFLLLPGYENVSHSISLCSFIHDETVSPNSSFLPQVVGARYFGTEMQKFEQHSDIPP